MCDKKMKTVKQMQLQGGLTVGALVSEMRRCGVLGAGKIGEAAELAADMFSDTEYVVFLTIAGPMVPGGLRQIIRDLIDKGYVKTVVTTGANMVHDMVEALGYKHYVGTFHGDDKILRSKNIGRIGDIYIKQSAFRDLEKWIYTLLETIPQEKRKRISPAELLFEIGKQIQDPASILATAARKNVPVISPGFIDSITGFHLWVYSQDKTLGIDPLLDVTTLMNKVYSARKVGVIILGGGWPKHFALFANTFRDGVDCAIQITMDRPEPGGLSGATLDEAISWGKLKPKGKAVTVTCDATIAFPLIIASAFDTLE